jgi:SAM-dependent methyltransferase
MLQPYFSGGENNMGSDVDERIDELCELLHSGIRLSLEAVACHVKPGMRMLFVGSGTGQFARYAAWCFQASELHLVDYAVAPNIWDPLCVETFSLVDVTTDEFVQAFSGKVDVILSFMTVHELEDPLRGITNMLRVLPKRDGCFAWVLDLSAYRWMAIREEGVAGIPEEYREHVRADLENVTRQGLDDQQYVYSLYECAMHETGHTIWKKGILGSEHSTSQDIYEVMVGNWRTS